MESGGLTVMGNFFRIFVQWKASSFGFAFVIQIGCVVVWCLQAFLGRRKRETKAVMAWKFLPIWRRGKVVAGWQE